jgi:hypothetical protein
MKPIGREPEWLEVDPALAARAQRGLKFLLLPVAIFGGVTAFLFHDSLAENPGLLVHLALVLLALLAAALCRPKGPPKAPPRFRGLRVGVSERGLHYELARGMALLSGRPGKGVAPWKEVYFDGRRLLANGVAIPVKEPLFGDIFEPSRFAALVVAQIPQRNVLTPAQLGRRMLRGQGILSWILLVLGAIAAAAWLMTKSSL